MKVEAMIVSKDVPKWASGRHVYVDDKCILLLSQKPTLIWPRWWHRLGHKLGWRWLENYKGFD